MTRLAPSPSIISCGPNRVSQPIFFATRQFSNMSISEKLAEELAHETSETEIDQELIDSIAAIKKSFAISDLKGEGLWWHQFLRG
jgi:hypothetical protein